MDLIVEVSPGDDPEAWRDLFHQLRAAGFNAYERANEYDRAWYLSRGRLAQIAMIERVDYARADAAA
jgi:hypothetical protein